MLLGATMQRCKPCRWSGGQFGLDAIEDMYVQWARHRTIAALTGGRGMRGTLALERIAGCDDHLHWPVTTPVIQSGRVTITTKSVPGWWMTCWTGWSEASSTQASTSPRPVLRAERVRHHIQ